MIANYGYSDAEGEFYITIDTALCPRCEAKPCMPACPEALIVEEEDPYGDTGVAIDESKRKQLKYACSACKPDQDRPPLPCVTACPFDAIQHSW